jgi:hypothetical protein
MDHTEAKKAAPKPVAKKDDKKDAKAEAKQRFLDMIASKKGKGKK